MGSVIPFKASVIATTSSLQGFTEEISTIRVQGRFSCPILKKELPAINHLPNGNDRIILPGGVNPEDCTNHTSLSRATGRKRGAIPPGRI